MHPQVDSPADMPYPAGVRRKLATLVLRLFGWQMEGNPPEPDKYVLIAAPHTSNWDLIYLLAFAEYYGIRISFMAKHTLFRGPMGWGMRLIGGIPVRRNRRNDLVQESADFIRQSDDLALVVGLSGLFLHAFLEGAAFAPSGGGVGTTFAAAVVTHRISVGLVIWWLIRPRFGIGLAAVGV